MTTHGVDTSSTFGRLMDVLVQYIPYSRLVSGEHLTAIRAAVSGPPRSRGWGGIGWAPEVFFPVADRTQGGPYSINLVIPIDWISSSSTLT
jgi:hypothetical protein